MFNDATTTTQASTRIQATLVNTRLAIERITTSLLNSKELLPNVQALTPGDQTRFVDKVDQVCRNG